MLPLCVDPALAWKPSPYVLLVVAVLNRDRRIRRFFVIAAGMLALGSLGYGPGDREKMLTLAEEDGILRDDIDHS
ncbi:hypothetical protein Scep_021460 [Stephania cephalantha]|uniref:Uncharacterized protein n=1 Tax=Stephania cephalantha TaxID=152367 RepID=A0AAP0F3H2_9MAGN